MTKAERAVAIRVRGRVQGVGYRAFVQDEAVRLNIRGWVVNRDDGSVEAALHGAGPALADLIEGLRRGPAGAKVDGLDVQSTDRAKIGEMPHGGYAF